MIFLAVTKLELTWVGKDEPMQKIEPRLLLHHKEKSYGEAGTGNLLIHGDNLLALRALLPKYGGRVKCIAAFFKNQVTLFDFKSIKNRKTEITVGVLKG